MLLRVSLPVSLRRVVDRVPPPPADVGAAAPAPPPHSTPAPGSARFGIRDRRAPRGESPPLSASTEEGILREVHGGESPPLSASTEPPRPRQGRAPRLRTGATPPAAFRARPPGRGPPAWDHGAAGSGARTRRRWPAGCRCLRPAAC